LGAIFFTFQIYGDFSGYSDIALGTARLFGIDLLRNFAFPYFSRDIAEFWRRWHISLSSWFRDYLYIPLGGSKGGMWMKIRNTFIIFLVSGFWHGANWTFIMWGFLNALFIMPSIIFKTNRNNLDIVARGRYQPSLKEFFQIAMTFGLTVFAWIFFRSDSLTQAFEIITKIFSKTTLAIPEFRGLYKALVTAILVVLFIVLEWIGRQNDFAIQRFGFGWNSKIRWGFYFLLVSFIFYFAGKEQVFIYFNF
jgi:D-alanyl-lipoteichoic acid acyltransferase DltB (MBOAT superfamily)